MAHGPNIEIGNVPNGFWLILKWQDARQHSHSVHTEVSAETVEDGARKILNYFQNGGQVEDLFIKL